jgi:hypothetical protein
MLRTIKNKSFSCILEKEYVQIPFCFKFIYCGEFSYLGYFSPKQENKAWKNDLEGFLGQFLRKKMKEIRQI